MDLSPLQLSLSSAQVQKKVSSLAPLLLAWYDQNKRELPWRQDNSAYRVWVSEIMLQQTRVAAVIPYFERFMQALPTVQALAQADETTLAKLWEGLGYYSRMRNLQRAAQKVVSDYNGVLPNGYEALLKLPALANIPQGPGRFHCVWYCGGGGGRQRLPRAGKAVVLPGGHCPAKGKTGL